MIKKNIKGIIISILIALFFGFIGNILGGNTDNFNNLNKPQFSPEKILFPIVWTILFVLMGISSYIIYKSKSENKKETLNIYFIQLIINSLWSLFFFRLEWKFFSFIWILILIIFVLINIIKFYKINKYSAYLLFPYFIWLIFAAYLNLGFYLLN